MKSKITSTIPLLFSNCILEQKKFGHSMSPAVKNCHGDKTGKAN